MKHGLVLCLLIAGIALAGCSKTSKNTSVVSKEDAVLRERREKDLGFKSDPNSPVPKEDRASFQGLSYFSINPGLRFNLKLNRYPAPGHLRMATNTGEVRSFLRYGYFEFQVDGKLCRLQVYRDEDPGLSGEPTLFIPFKDATTGKETYAAGRYIELKENTSGFYDLDFNRAFNPWCAYGKGFSCPVPPSENTLPVSIRAGEKAYHGRDHALVPGPENTHLG